MIDLNKKRTPLQWKSLLDNVKVSDIEALKQIEEGQADVSDIVGKVVR